MERSHGGLMNVTSLLRWQSAPGPSVRTEGGTPRDETLSTPANGCKTTDEWNWPSVGRRNEVIVPREVRLYAGPAELPCSILRGSGGREIRDGGVGRARLDRMAEVRAAREK